MNPWEIKRKNRGWGPTVHSTFTTEVAPGHKSNYKRRAGRKDGKKLEDCAKFNSTRSKQGQPDLKENKISERSKQIIINNDGTEPTSL